MVGGHIDCVFCARKEEDKVLSKDLAFAIFDNFPVSEGHMLVVTKRHISSFFESTTDERLAILQLLDECREFLQGKYNPDGHNIGVNVGESAGQTVMHLHFHLIPRYAGDMQNPRGGVRGVIPHKRIY